MKNATIEIISIILVGITIAILTYTIVHRTVPKENDYVPEVNFSPHYENYQVDKFKDKG